MGGFRQALCCQAYSGPWGHTQGSFVSGHLQPLCLWSKWGQMEVAAVLRHQWLPTILSSDVFAPLLSQSLFVVLNFQKICIWEDKWTGFD